MTTFEIPQDQMPDRRQADSEATILQFPSPTEKGFFEPEISPDRNVFIARKVLGSEATRHGITSTEVYTLQNGREYEVVTGEPYAQRSDVPIVSTTALATSIRGHNRHNLYQGMSLGYPVVLIGPEGGHSHIPTSRKAARQAVRNLLSINLAETAENMHEILEITDRLGFYEPGKIISTGESRGAMIGMGVKSRASKFGRLVIYSDLTAPCFPMPRKEIERRTNLPMETIRQTSLMGHLPLKLHPRRLAHYPATLNLNPQFLLHVVGTIPTLLSGSAGKLAREIDQDAYIHNTLFRNDTWSFPEGWSEIFAEYPNVVNTLRPGNHMGITDELTLKERSNRLGGLRDELAANHNRMAGIDWRNVHMAGREALKHA